MRDYDAKGCYNRSNVKSLGDISELRSGQLYFCKLDVEVEVKVVYYVILNNVLY